jgi:hypothetical protein
MSDSARVLPAVNMNEEINKAIQDAVNVDDIKAALIAEAEKQGVVADTQAAADAAKAAADAAKLAADAGAQTFTRTEVIGGKEFTFEASSEAELDRIALNAYKVAFAVQPTERAQEVVVDHAAQELALKAAQEAEIVAKAELEAKYKRGEITLGDYIEQSGAVDSYLAKKGVSVESLQDSVNSNRDKKFEQSWADATNEFLQGPGADWPGGSRNREMLSMKVAALGLTEAEDKVLALTKAYAEMKRTNMVFENDAVAAPVADATTTDTNAGTTYTPENVKALVDKAVADALVAARVAVPARRAATSSSMFDQSSGVSGNAAPAAPNVSADKAAAEAAAKGASPAEILEAWKAAQVAGGIDPNAAFISTFKAGRTS